MDTEAKDFRPLARAHHTTVGQLQPCRHDVDDLSPSRGGHRPVSRRQIVFLWPEEGAAWLNLQRPESELLLALPAGSLNLEKVFPIAA